MILDGFLSFSTPATPDALAQVAGTYYSNNVLDLGLTGIPTSASGGGARDFGIGDSPSLKLSVVVSTAFTSAGSPTLTVNLQGAPDNGSGGIGSYTTYATSGAITLANLGLGARLFDIDWPRPPAGLAPGRFYRLSYVIATATTTAGAVIASVVLDRYDQYQTATVGTVGGYPAGIYIAN